MLMSEIITKVRTATLHDDDEQFTSAQLRDDCLALEYRRLLTWICVYVPSLREAVVSGIVVSGGAGVIPKSSLPLFERLRRIEKSDGSTYWSIDVADGLDADNPRYASVRENATQLVLEPAAHADGTYKVVYLTGAPASIVDGTTIDLPDLLIPVLVHRGAMWVCARHTGDRERLPYHTEQAKQLMLEAHTLLVQRYGDHGESGLRYERR
jgi:hypothetical protein